MDKKCPAGFPALTRSIWQSQLKIQTASGTITPQVSPGQVDTLPFILNGRMKHPGGRGTGHILFECPVANGSFQLVVSEREELPGATDKHPFLMPREAEPDLSIPFREVTRTAQGTPPPPLHSPWTT